MTSAIVARSMVTCARFGKGRDDVKEDAHYVWLGETYMALVRVRSLLRSIRVQTQHLESLLDENENESQKPLDVDPDPFTSAITVRPPRRVLLESPFAGRGSTEETRERNASDNLSYAYRAMREALRRGEAPFASHLLYTLVLDDKIPEDRHLGIEAGLAWGVPAEASVVYVDRGITEGMWRGILRAEMEHRPIEFRSLMDAELPESLHRRGACEGYCLYCFREGRERDG